MPGKACPGPSSGAGRRSDEGAVARPGVCNETGRNSEPGANPAETLATHNSTHLRDTTLGRTAAGLREEMMVDRAIGDIYRCPYCDALRAKGDSYCRGCGRRFSDEDVQQMEAKKQSTVGATPWNLRDSYRCQRCAKFVSINDTYCRGCGARFDEKEVERMKASVRELAEHNTPALLGLMVFVLVVILVSIGIVR